MEKTIAAIELGSRKVKLVVGYELDGQVYPIYAYSKPYGRLIKDGVITDSQKLVDAVNAIKDFTDQNAKLSFKITECVLALPANGLQIFHTKERTPVISERGRISHMDIKNLFSLVKNTSSESNNGSTLVDIIPEEYILDEERLLKENPIGAQAKRLVLVGKVHMVPTSIYSSFIDVMTQAEVEIPRTVVSSFADAEYISSLGQAPASYLLVNVGGCSTTVSLIGNGVLYGSKCFEWGGESLTRKIANSLEISIEDAEKLKVLYGIDDRSNNLHAPVTTRVGEDGTKVNFYPDHLNKIICDELDNFADDLKTNFEVLLAKQDRLLFKLPIVFVGGATQLNGFEKYISSKLLENEVKVVNPKTIGARDATFSTCLGMILVASKYASVNEETHLKVNGISRD